MENAFYCLIVYLVTISVNKNYCGSKLLLRQCTRLLYLQVSSSNSVYSLLGLQQSNQIKMNNEEIQTLLMQSLKNNKELNTNSGLQAIGQ